MLIVNFLLLISFGAVFGFPSFDELMHEQGDDTAVVESVVREARAVGPTHIADLLGPENTEEDDGEETKNLYRIASEDNQNKKSKKAVEDYDYGYEGDSGDSAKYSDGEAESEGEGGSSYEGGEGKSASYSSGGGDSGSYSSGGDYSESEGYSEGDEY